VQEQRQRLPGMQGMARYDIHFIGILRSGTQKMQRRESQSRRMSRPENRYIISNTFLQL